MGSRIEVSPASFKIARQIGELLHDETTDGSRSAGSALIVDYGGNKVYGNSFRVRPRSLFVIASIPLGRLLSFACPLPLELLSAAR